MGHAGAIVSGSAGTAAAKAQALEAKGVRVGRTPTEAAEHRRRGARRRRRVSAARPDRRAAARRRALRWRSVDDREIASTLGELERKLRELERVLGAIGERRSRRRPPRRDTAPRPTPRPQPGADRARRSRPPAPASRRASRRRRCRPRASAERWPRARPRRARPRHRRRAATTRAPARDAPTPPAPRPPREPPARRPPPRPTSRRAPSELLRFRERLERTARELTHDYDELLGRLSYPAVPQRRPDPRSPSPAARRRWTSSTCEGLRDAAVRAFESDPAGTTAYGTSIGYPRLRAWIADRHGVEPERVLVTNGSMQADAFLFEHARARRATRWSSSARPTTARCCRCASAARACTRSSCSPTASTPTRSRACSRGPGVRPKLAHIIPNFQNPAGYTLSLAKRQALLALAARARLHGVRGRPLRRAALQRRVAADDALDGPRARRVRVVVLEDRLPGHPRRLPRRPAAS